MRLFKNEKLLISKEQIDQFLIAAKHSIAEIGTTKTIDDKASKSYCLRFPWQQYASKCCQNIFVLFQFLFKITFCGARPCSSLLMCDDRIYSEMGRILRCSLWCQIRTVQSLLGPVVKYPRVDFCGPCFSLFATCDFFI